MWYVSLLHLVCLFYSGVCGYSHPWRLVKVKLWLGLLSPSYEEDNTGNFLVVECGSLKGRLYVAKMDSTKRGVGKCIFFNGKWLTPSEFESLGGKKAKNGNSHCCI